jgi:c-di-GMP-binding flagellar brake protein YcgR
VNNHVDELTSNVEDAAQQYKRKFVRVDVEVPAKFEAAESGTWITAKIKDIGGGGVRMATTQDLPLGLKLQLRFGLPKSARELVAVGRIVLSFYEAKTNTFVHGIAFTAISGRDKDQIIDYVAEILRQEASAKVSG